MEIVSDPVHLAGFADLDLYYEGGACCEDWLSELGLLISCENLEWEGNSFSADYTAVDDDGEDSVEDHVVCSGRLSSPAPGKPETDRDELEIYEATIEGQWTHRSQTCSEGQCVTITCNSSSEGKWRVEHLPLKEKHDNPFALLYEGEGSQLVKQGVVVRESSSEQICSADGSLPGLNVPPPCSCRFLIRDKVPRSKIQILFGSSSP